MYGLYTINDTVHLLSISKKDKKSIISIYSTSIVHLLKKGVLTGFTRAGHCRQETGSLTVVALTLVVREQLKRLALSLLCPLR